MNQNSLYIKAVNVSAGVVEQFVEVDKKTSTPSSCTSVFFTQNCYNYVDLAYLSEVLFPEEASLSSFNLADFMANIQELVALQESLVQAKPNIGDMGLMNPSLNAETQQLISDIDDVSSKIENLVFDFSNFATTKNTTLIIEDVNNFFISYDNMLRDLKTTTIDLGKILTVDFQGCIDDLANNVEGGHLSRGFFRRITKSVNKVVTKDIPAAAEDVVEAIESVIAINAVKLRY